MKEQTSAIDTGLLLGILQTLGPVNDGIGSYFAHTIQEGHLSKRHLLLKEGDTCKRLWLIKKGFARAYYYDYLGQEHTTWFMGEGTVIISVQSFFTQTPSYENIELLEDCIIQSISWRELQELYRAHPEFNLHGRLLTENYYIRSEQRAIMLRCKTPDQRYDRLLEAHPDIFQRAGQSQIASYLGIQRETLNRLRKSRTLYS